MKPSLSRMVLGIAVGLSVIFYGLVAQAADLSGNYRVDGRNPNGSAYEGSVQIVDNNGAIAMSWQVGKAYSGVGRIEGRVLTVDWGSSDPVIYVINNNGTLYGTWAKGKALELLTPR